MQNHWVGARFGFSLHRLFILEYLQQYFSDDLVIYETSADYNFLLDDHARIWR
jgi:hypothetical protein